MRLRSCSAWRCLAVTDKVPPFSDCYPMTVDPFSTYVLPPNQTLVIEISGSDAAKVINNLTTNDFAALPNCQTLETFVTDLRGWTVAHGIVLKNEVGVWLLGSHPNASQVAAHLDRYIIREDASVIDHSSEFAVAWSLADELPQDDAVRSALLPATAVTPTIMFGPRQRLLKLTEQRGARMLNEAQWQLRRVQHKWPQMGMDILEKCIPQEVDRTTTAISFHKGCYLGQETIARLDARGQLQKKLCLLHFEDQLTLPASVLADGKEIGQITSLAVDMTDGTSYALAYLRRGYFELDQAVQCGAVAGRVIAPKN
jgi:tRNA-modifying protein YgfZ